MFPFFQAHPVLPFNASSSSVKFLYQCNIAVWWPCGSDMFSRPVVFDVVVHFTINTWQV